MGLSKLLHLSAYESENQFELSLREAFEGIEPRLRPPFSSLVPSPSEYIQLSQAILFGVLSESHLAKVHMKHLHAIITDGYGFFVTLLVKVVMELYPKLVDTVKVQLLWVTSEMVDVSAVGVDGLLVSLLRQIGNGDFSEGNLWLCFELVSLFSLKWDCLFEEVPLVLASALYTFLRLLADHYKLPSSASMEALKRMEIEFCVKVLTEQFHLCLKIGRDLVRLLQDLGHIPEFQVIWKKLLLNPTEFRTPEFLDISQIYCSRTSSRYFLLRITPEMEIQLRFLLSHVRLGRQKRHQAWFARKYLSGPEKETLICDIVRFICCAHHPPNDIIQSDVLPRWAVIGWLLKCCRKNYIEANVKLSLFYDWLFFDETIDNIMNIEPAILLMLHSIPHYIDITHSLIDFLLLLVDNYDTERGSITRRGVLSAFNTLVRKGVVQSLDVLTSCQVLSPALKDKLRLFFSGAPSGSQSEIVPAQVLSYFNVLTSTVGTETEALVKGRGNTPSDNVVIDHKSEASLNGNYFYVVDNLMKNFGEIYRQSRNTGLKVLEKVLFSLLDFSTDGQASEAEHFCSKITSELELNGYKLFAPLEVHPDQPNYDDEFYSATALIISIFIFSQHRKMLDILLIWTKSGLPVGARMLSYASRFAYEAESLVKLETLTLERNCVEAKDSRIPVLKFHIDVYTTFANSGRNPGMSSPGPKLDRLFLTGLIDGCFAAYRYFLGHVSNASCKGGDTSLIKYLIYDIISCSRWDENRRKFLFCSIFCQLSDICIGEEQINHLLVEHMDHADLLAIQVDIGLGRFSLFGDSNKTINLIKSSLSWGSLEQYKLWALIKSEIVITKIHPEKLLLQFFCSDSLDPSRTSIAVSGFLSLLCSLSPTTELVGAIMLIPSTVVKDFSAAVLSSWAASNASLLFTRLADFFELLQNKNGNSPISLGGLMINQSAMFWLFNYLDAKEMQGIDIMHNSSGYIPDIQAKLKDLAALSKVKA